MWEMNRWLVTSRHLDSSSPDGRAPWGVRHARRSGDDRTACGAWAHGWPMFWHLRFDESAAASACETCAQAVLDGAQRVAV